MDDKQRQHFARVALGDFVPEAVDAAEQGESEQAIIEALITVQGICASIYTIARANIPELGMVFLEVVSVDDIDDGCEPKHLGELASMLLASAEAENFKRMVRQKIVSEKKQRPHLALGILEGVEVEDMPADLAGQLASIVEKYGDAALKDRMMALHMTEEIVIPYDIFNRLRNEPPADPSGRIIVTI